MEGNHTGLDFCRSESAAFQHEAHQNIAAMREGKRFKIGGPQY